MQKTQMQRESSYAECCYIFATHIDRDSLLRFVDQPIGLLCIQKITDTNESKPMVICIHVFEEDLTAWF
jgi:hypothetical protein